MSDFSRSVHRVEWTFTLNFDPIDIHDVGVKFLKSLLFYCVTEISKTLAHQLLQQAPGLTSGSLSLITGSKKS